MDKEAKRIYMREYKRKQRENKEFREAESKRNAEYMKTVYKEKNNENMKNRYRVKQQKAFGGTFVPYEKRYDFTCNRCGEVFKANKINTLYCPDCRGNR